MEVRTEKNVQPGEGGGRGEVDEELEELEGGGELPQRSWCSSVELLFFC